MSSSNYYSDQQSTRPSISTNSTSKSSSTIGTTSGIPLVPPLPQFLNTRSNDNRVQFSNPAATSKPSLNVPQSQFKSDNLNDNHTHQGYSEANEFIRRKKSLVRPERERINEQHRLFNYRNHAAAAELEGRIGGPGAGNYTGLDYDDIVPNRAFQDSTNLRRGKSILAREEGMANESGLSMFKRGATLRRPNVLRGNSESAGGNASAGGINGLNEKNRLAPKVKQPLGPWMIFCLTVTICCPFPMLKWFGLRTKERQEAWREKMGLLVIICVGMLGVGFLTFAFTTTVCGQAPLAFPNGNIGGGSMIYNGYAYGMDKFEHPAAAGIAGGSNPLYTQFDASAKDGSFLFQKVNQNCLGIITPAAGTGIPSNGQELGWYFPCNLYNQWGSSSVNKTGYAEGVLCHTQSSARSQFTSLEQLGRVSFEWSDLQNTSRNIGVYDGNVLDFSLLQWLDTSQVAFPALFDEIKFGNSAYRGRDITALMASSGQRDIADCMVDVLRVGFVTNASVGCITSSIVLYVSLTVIIGVVVIRFIMAVLFGWFLSWRIGTYKDETYQQRRDRAREIEDWTDDIYRPAPARYRPNVKAQKKSMLPKTSRFTKGGDGTGSAPSLGAAGSTRPESKYGEYRKSGNFGSKSMLGPGMKNSPPGSPMGGYKTSRSSASLPGSTYNFDAMARQPTADGMMGACPFPLYNVVPQPPPDFEPFNYPLVHTILLVTAYSESVEGLRTTLDSLCTTDYPNSHKVILVIADGMVKGSGNNLTTPEIALGMMKELIVPAEDVEAYSYVAIADGHKQHNRAKIYSGFYEYDNNTVELSKQQRVPFILLAKVGNAREVNDAKPGNRGKRDSQVVLMAFLQKVMFDERMSVFEYEFFNNLWRCTGVSPDRFETVLCVDADTKVFPDSVSRMNACMVHDPEIMGLCGETKIANKSDTWVTMIQVFEYYVSHHLTKAFESVFGRVTCLPGCFSMYRIKSPKGGEGYWVPILANPDIVEHYQENVVDTLHKKNLLLLGEDRYLTTLMLRTFPRRKLMFCPQAVCKTVVPDTFRVLLSQRRRWINSTVHNLFELFTVPDLCGTFCFSMRFIVFMELAGTLVLPAAIVFTLYIIILTIIPGTVKPVVSLILLAIILGIPALLIVMTSRRFAYLGWMLIYLFSLPIWNFVLPAYAFLHMDDFTWGETRKIVGGKDGGHGDQDDAGLFDSSSIVMRRWVDFERDRRYKSGIQSRDSTYDVLYRSGSPGRSGSTRNSVVSSVDTYLSGGAASSLPGEALFRQSSPGVSAGSINASDSDGHISSSAKFPSHIELPAPLAKTAYDNNSNFAMPRQSSAYDFPRYEDDSEEEREGILARNNGSSKSWTHLDTQSSVSSSPFHSSSSDNRSEFFANYRDESVIPPVPRLPTPSAAQRHSRGISLIDPGPVAGSEGGMRSVQRQTRRASSSRPRQQSTNSSSNTHTPSQSFSSPISPTLPPGASPARRT